MPMWMALVILFCLTFAGAPEPASAQLVVVPETWGGDFMSRGRLTGSWGGLRDELGKKGVVLDVDLLLTPQRVLHGGHETDGEIWGAVDYTLNVDTGKLGLWPGGFLNLYGSSSFGESVFSEAGTLPVNTLPLFPEPDDPANGLMGATFTQFLSPKFGVVGGKIFTVDGGHADFTGNYRTQFSNTALVLPVALALVPLAAFGGGVIALPWEGVILSLLALDPSGTVESNDVGEAFDDGVMLLAAGTVAVAPFGLKGHQKLGVMWSNKERLSLDQDPSNLSNFLLNTQFPKLGNPGPILGGILERFFPGLLTPVQPARHDESTWAMYYGFEQYLWHPDGDPERGIGVFFTFGAADPYSSPIEFSYMTGIGGKGVVPGRPRDTFGIGWARTEFSDELLPFLRDQLPLGLDHEDAVEIYYNVSVTSWLNATLDLQVIEPGVSSKLGSGGLEDVDTTVVGGLRFRVRF